MNIYELKGRVLEIERAYEQLQADKEMVENAIADNNGEVDAYIDGLQVNIAQQEDELEYEYATVCEELAEKPDQYLAWYKNTKAQADALKTAKAELEKKLKTVERKCEFIKELVGVALKENGLTKIKGDMFSAYVKESPAIATDRTVLLTPYIPSINEFGRTLPAWLCIEAKILKSAMDKENLPAGASIENSTSVIIR